MCQECAQLSPYKLSFSCSFATNIMFIRVLVLHPAAAMELRKILRSPVTVLSSTYVSNLPEIVRSYPILADVRCDSTQGHEWKHHASVHCTYGCHHFRDDRFAYDFCTYDAGRVEILPNYLYALATQSLWQWYCTPKTLYCCVCTNSTRVFVPTSKLNVT